MLPLEGRSKTIFIVTTIFLGISFIAVCLRCFVRLKLVKAFGWDDALMVFAMGLNVLFALCGITGALYGMGQRSLELVHRGTMETAMFWWWLGQTSYVWTCAIAKISIAVALLRLTVARAHYLILWGVISVTTIIGLIFWFMLTLQCHPVSYFWQRARLVTNPEADVHGHCISVDTIIDMAYVYSVTACCCDLVLGLLPIFLVWNLQMNIRTKAALAGILGMGCVASAAVIVRIPYLHHYKDTDFLYATVDISIWSNVEASLGIAAGSLVTLRPLFRWFRDPSYGGTRSKRTGNSMPLSSANAIRSDPAGPQYWRPDLDPEDTNAVITTIHTSNRGSRTSSQEDLNPKQRQEQGTFFRGVNVQKTFFVSGNEE
ncbi:P-type ATPase [Penicillium brasilianum]|uniref:P-type ATPase n=1 Tax=Penicillium brasilianum TaxID=104259 RepID=A0A1S9REB8_PENBI|nr:P-type ATPase [Penicillium brasilianum]